MVDITESEIESRIHSFPVKERAHQTEEKGLAQAAVLIPLLKKGGEWHILFTRRAETLKTHKGQVAFPGGRRDDEDDRIECTAVRETWEEIGIQPDEISLLGWLDQVSTPSGFLITPVVGTIEWPYELEISEAEVSRVFTIPLLWLANPDNFQVRTLTRLGKPVPGVVFFQPYEGELLWGVTARITLNFLIQLGFVLE